MKGVWLSFMLLQAEQKLDCALDLMRRLPPQQIEKNLSDLIDLVRKTVWGPTTVVFELWFGSRS